MRSPSSLKKEFLTKWVVGLRAWSSSSKEMGLLERKKAIKLSADVAMAAATNGTTIWSHTLINNASKDPNSKHMVQSILTSARARDQSNEPSKFPLLSPPTRCARNRVRSKKVLRKARINYIQRCSRRSAASLIAKTLVKKRTQVLKGLVPGGECMDESCLIKETLDYMISLRAQVLIMQHIAKVMELFNSK
ncbi:hypothetical protein Nepgr_005810 [Nepenthes gracilis]|uniref:IBH1-like N-terminal domain-containing protein n=1 Tax=Nepenthes gracilis TaxID=150966 RepID=A0AAD3S410_NEPGR|nr:hypothetical protein Nepgr_005810 [Nepenthes gracilis]